MQGHGPHRQLLALHGPRGRVSAQLSPWDELDAMPLLPPSLRPWGGVPVLDREQLRSLQAGLVEYLGELEERCKRG